MKTQGEDLSQQQPLGPPLKPPAAPPRQHEKVREGVYRDERGKLYTNIPEPPQPSIWEAFKKAGLV